MLFISILYAQSVAACANPRIRKEITLMTAQEITDLKNGLDVLQQSGRLSWYGQRHSELFEIIHGNNDFFPSHRAFLWQFETELRNASGNPTLTLPFIDEGSIADQFGTQVSNGLSLMNLGSMKGCVTGGLLKNWQSVYPEPHCISRDIDPTSVLRGRALIDSFISTTFDFTTFSSTFENSIHNAFHFYMGGDMAESYSSNDPIFFLHHAFNDYMVLRWQLIHGGIANLPTGIMGGKLLQTMPITVSQAMSMTGICVQYQDKPTVNAQLAKRQVNYKGLSPVLTNFNQYLPNNPKKSDYYNVLSQQASKYKANPSNATHTSCLQTILEYHQGSLVFLPINKPIEQDKLKKMKISVANVQLAYANMDNTAKQLAQVGHLQLYDATKRVYV
eukprot:NODE_431_length_7570_cov_0.606263.p1 type:complete len:389 gc:universal NODE_431_length_7570_cov_0.606263:4116-5282(+)